MYADKPPWKYVKELLSESWYVDCNVERAMDRVFLRQTSNGVEDEVANKRV